MPLPLTSRLLPDGTLRLETPRVFLPLLKPARFKGARGGRGGAKSHFVAERLIAKGIAQHTRAACLREYQSSIKESVKTLLEDKIRQFGVNHMFTATEAEIRGPNDSLYVFKGLHDYVSRPGGGPAANIKSLEGFTDAWGEEAQTFSTRSLQILTPTFRGRPDMEMQPELWFTWNPGRETDPIERFFNENAGDPDFTCVTTTYKDNPWFEASGLRRDMERDKARDYATYAHIWLGEYLTRSEAHVFSIWTVERFETPSDARIYFGADWGFANDPSTLVRCWKRGHDLFVDYEAHMIGCRIEQHPALWMTVPESKKWRIRADSARPELIDYMRRRGFNVVPAIKGKDSVEEGITFLQGYDIHIHERCQHTAGEFLTYKYKIDPRSDEILPQLIDWNDHCIDALRYALEGERRGGRPLIIPPAELQKFANTPMQDRFAGVSAAMVTRNRFARAR